MRTPYDVSYVRHEFAAYQEAMRTLDASYRSVPERRAAIQIRDEFLGGVEGHLATALAAHDELLEALKDLHAWYCAEHEFIPAVESRASAAIAKAEGGSNGQ